MGEAWRVSELPAADPGGTIAHYSGSRPGRGAILLPVPGSRPRIPNWEPRAR